MTQAKSIVERAAEAYGHEPNTVGAMRMRAALLSALEPTDEVVEAVAAALYNVSSFPLPGIAARTWTIFAMQEPADAEVFRGQARAALSALRAIVEGDGK